MQTMFADLPSRKRTKDGTYTNLNYSEVKSAVADLLPFVNSTGSMRGYWHKHAPWVYVVYSYSTPIAEFDSRTNEVTVPDVKYSVTTTKQQNICRAWLARNRRN